MAARRARSRPRRGTIIGTVSVVVVLGLLVTLAVTAQGYQAQVVPKVESSVWVARNSGQYARVNTDLGEIDTVRSVADPTDVVQSGADDVIYSEGNRQVWQVNSANPVDLVGASSATASKITTTSKNTPIGTRTIASAGIYVVYLTDLGKVFLGEVSSADGDGAQPVDPSVTSPVDPFAGNHAKNAPTYVASAAAVAADGEIVLYSAAEHAIREFDATTHEFQGEPQTVASPPPAAAKLQLTIVNGKWALSDPLHHRVWIQGHNGAIGTTLAGSAQLESSSPHGDRVYLADTTTLVGVNLTTGAVASVAKGTGVPAVPTDVNGTIYAAWLSSTSGTLWSSATGRVIPLKIDGNKLKSVESITPVIQSNGQRGVLSEQSSGMLWTLPTGTLIPLSEWSLGDTEHDLGTVKVTDVAQEEPPVAVADSFGVRRGEVVQLPVLLNDHDPNKRDVLTITPTSIAGGLSDKAFGDLGLVDNDQEAVVTVRAASGSATFSYTASDGTLTSAPATVTLTVVPPSINSAPKWCGVTACVQQWPRPQIAPGGTITVPVLFGWVDPEGDPFVLSDARKVNPNDPVTVVPTSDGSVAIRHLDPNASGSIIPILVTVTDSGGASATKTLDVVVTGSPSLVASPVAVVAGEGDATTVSIADHVSGGSGSFRLLDATTTSTGSTALSVTPNTAAGQIVLSASKAGNYVVTYTVQDTQTLAQQSSLIRLTVIGGQTPLTMAPLTAFVRSNEDTTINVLDAVQNTSGRVLIVASATTADPTLSASIVGQTSVRVSGTTPNGQPGRVGSAIVTVTDGAGSTVQSVLTVFLVPSSTDVGPIAEPDAVTVRAGAEVDIPVTNNDVSPRGERLMVSPTLQGSGTKGELAFVAGNLVRYLAPEKAGTYVLHYSVYLESDPSRLATTSITVVVLAKGTNRPPDPPVLVARVLGGQSVSIPVPSYGMDPDGDPVVLTSVAQPQAGSGVAEISADGESIIYTAPGNGVAGGQVSFQYTVRDPQNASASGTVRVGVLDSAIADSSPVAYSDYVRVEKGSTTPVTVLPLLNDTDPAEGTLKLVALVPNAPSVATNPEYARLKSLIAPTTALADGRVQLRAGDVLGTQSYIYTVQSSVTSSTSQGLIVVTVTDTPAADSPVVTDTVVTAKDRSHLATGIDVITGKVQWPTGNVGGLTLAVWGDQAANYTVHGSDISGKLPAAGALVPFSVTGADSAGNKVVSYGFLRIPAFDDMRVQLNPDLKPVSVAEEKSATFDLRKEVDVGPTDVIEIRHDKSFAVQRAASSCAWVGGLTAQYTAGRNAPWTDSCTVPVRIVGQHNWTMLAVPIAIAPKDPQAELNSISRTIAPGATETVDLYGDMTTWEGGRVGNKTILDYVASFAGSAFVVTQTGTTVSIVARADAAPGTRQAVKVGVTSFGGLSAYINLVIGVAPPDAPLGATFTHTCHVTDGASCTIPVVGVSGEYDPFKGTLGSGLHLVSVGTGSPVACAVATVSVVGDTSVQAVWPSGPKPVGGQCIVPFTVKDAQGRLGNGQLTIDVQGYPQTPASIITTNYSATSVTLTVALGEATEAHPAVTDVDLYEDGDRVSNVSCAPSGIGNFVCVVSGLVNGAVHRYTARAVNGQGESADTSAVSTWAYAAPVISNASAKAIYVPGETGPNTAVVQLSISSADDTRSFTVSPNGETINRTGGVTVQNVELTPGTAQVTITPTSQFQPPLSGNSNAGDPTQLNIDGAAGSPFFTPNTPSGWAASNTSITVSGISLSANFSTEGTTIKYLAWEGGNEPSCGANADGSLSVGSGGVQSDTSTFTGLDAYRKYFVKVCGSNGFGFAQSATIRVFTGVSAPDPAGPYTYTVNKTAVAEGGGVFVYDLQTPPAVPDVDGFTTEYMLYNTTSTTFSLSESQVPFSVRVEYCSTTQSGFCSSHPATITATTAPTIVRVTFPTCAPLVPSTGDVDVSNGANGSQSVTVTPGVGSAQYSVSWTGSFASLTAVTSDDIPTCQ